MLQAFGDLQSGSWMHTMVETGREHRKAGSLLYGGRKVEKISYSFDI